MTIFLSFLGLLPFCSAWQQGIATWYGEPNGPGSNGGACGYGVLPSSPYGSKIAAAGDSIFLDGHGCGTCYEVKCTENVCQDNPVKVVITDRCPECSSTHLDLSGAAISSLGQPGKASNVRDIGIINILTRRVDCAYQKAQLTFTIDAGSSVYWLAFVVKFVSGSGDLNSVELQQQERPWVQVSKNWGASYKSFGFHPGPISLRVTTTSGSVFICRNTIPLNWKPGLSYVCSS